MAAFTSAAAADYRFYATYLGQLGKGQPSNRWKVVVLWRTPGGPILRIPTPSGWGIAYRTGFNQPWLSAWGHLAGWLSASLCTPQDAGPDAGPRHGSGIRFG